jgi:hypothetical protein
MSELVQATADRLTAFISENYSNADTAPGSVISELVIKLAATLQNNQYNKITTLSQGSAISQALSSSVDTYSPVIDLIASNYNTARNKGTYSKGKIQVRVSSTGNYSISSIIQFIQPTLHLIYQVDQAYRIALIPNTAAGELQLYQDSIGYYFILPVTATEVGYSSQVSSGTTFSITSTGASITNFVSAQAYGNFTSALPEQTDKDLIASFKNTLGSTRFESPAGIQNRLADIYPTFQTLSVCGANNIEMTRSKNNAMGISTFGMADVYIRNCIGAETYSASVVGKKIGDKTWVLNLDNSYCAGFYRVFSIVPDTAQLTGGTFPITNVVYGYRSFETGINNVINNYKDARFTKYQTATVTFKYDESPGLAVGSTLNFIVSAYYQPNIGEIQDLVSSSAERLACADYLIKATLPCFVELELTLAKDNPNDTYTSLNINNLKQDLFTYINTIPFGETVHASKIVTICHNYNISRVELPITMTGNILCNDGSSLKITGGDYLEIPTDISLGVSPKTTQFFINYYDTSTGGTNVVDNIGITLI